MDKEKEISDRVKPGFAMVDLGGGMADQTRYDVVSFPKHYQGKAGLEVIQVIEAFDLDKNFYRANCVKYILRAEKKGAELQDLKKARFYLDREISILEGKK